MTKGLHRYYGTQDLHFITCSCYHRLQKLGTPKRRDLCASILEETRRQYRFVVHGYVIMPEHFHLLITEPEEDDPGVVMKVLKERFARQVNRALDESLVSHSFAQNANEWGTRRYLDMMKAEANAGGPGQMHIILRPDATKATVLEEFLHGTQSKLGIIDRLGVPGAEEHVVDFMQRHAKLLGLE